MHRGCYGHSSWRWSGVDKASKPPGFNPLSCVRHRSSIKRVKVVGLFWFIVLAPPSSLHNRVDD